MISLGINGCRCVVPALVSIGVNVGCLAGDLVVLEIWCVNLLRQRARKTSGCKKLDVAVQVSSRAGPVQTRCNALNPLPRGL